MWNARREGARSALLLLLLLLAGVSESRRRTGPAGMTHRGSSVCAPIYLCD